MGCPEFLDYEEDIADCEADECLSGDEGEYAVPLLDVDDMSAEDIDGLRQLDAHLHACYGQGSKLYARNVACSAAPAPSIETPDGDAELVPFAKRYKCEK